MIPKSGVPFQHCCSVTISPICAHIISVNAPMNCGVAFTPNFSVSSSTILPIENHSAAFRRCQRQSASTWLQHIHTSSSASMLSPSGIAYRTFANGYERSIHILSIYCMLVRSSKSPTNAPQSAETPARGCQGWCRFTPDDPDLHLIGIFHIFNL